MDAPTFLDNFGIIADAPGGIEKLRGLVLELAVRGQLTLQDPDDGSVDDQLSAISSLVQPSKLVDPIRSEVTPWDIPPTWRWARFKEIVDFAPGKTPSTKDSSYWAEPELGQLWASISDMPTSGTLFTTARAISSKAVGAVMRRPPAPAGALLMSFKLTIGKVCRVGRPTYFNEAIIEIDTPREATKEYLFRTLPLLSLGGSSKAAIKGNTLNKGSITNIPIPFPPLGEQERIVAKVDELLQFCDDLEALRDTRDSTATRLRASSIDALTTAGADGALRKAWSRVSSNWSALVDNPIAIDELRDACLELAVRGNLTSPRPSDEHAAETLQRCSDARADLLRRGDNRRQSALPIPETVPYSLPDGWAWAQIDDCFQVSGGIQKSSKRRPVKNPHPYLRVANVQRGRLDLSEISEFELFDGELDRYRLEPGDLLVVEGNGSENEIGRCGRWDGQIDDCVHQNHLIRCRPLDCDLERYALLYLNSPSGSQIMKSLAVTTSGLYNLSVGKIRAIQIPLPPREERLRIIQAVDDLLSKCDDLDAALRERLSAAETLADGLLASVGR